MTRDAAGRATIRAVRVDTPLRIDGVLDEGPYRTIPAIAGFLQQEPREGQPSTEKTEAWVLFDDRNLYVAARCWESHPGRAVANEMRRDSINIYQNDNFGVILDTFYDRRNGFLFYTNPLGGMVETYITDERDSNRDWNTVWYVKTRRFDRGWTVEMAIPFKSLRYRAGGSQVWGINFRRIIRWKNELTFLTRIPAAYSSRGMQKLSSAATLVGIEPPPSSRNLEIKPYALADVTTDRVSSPPLANHLGSEAGFDVKYGVTRSLTFDFSYNTDFAQIEEDEQQVNLTRFSLFFPEKRDFFLEGQGIFAFGGVLNPRLTGGGGPGETPVLFFSRRIGLVDGRPVPIEAGARLSGKAGRYSVGILSLQTGEDRRAGAAAANFSVVRIKRDILRRSNIGLIFTNRSPSLEKGGANQAVGIDANLSLFSNLTIVGYVARTRTPRLGRGDDYSYRGTFDYAGDRYGLLVERISVADRFNPEVGFVRRAAFARSYVQGRFSPRPRSIRSIRKINFEGTLDYFTNTAGKLESRQVLGTIRTELSSGDSWTVEHERSLESLVNPFVVGDDVAIPVGSYGFTSWRSSYQLGPQRKVSGTISGSHGEFYNGRRSDAGYRGRVEVTPRLSIEPGVTVNWIAVPQGRFVTKLASTRATFTFTPRILVAALMQFNSESSLVTTSVRFRWEYQAGSDLFVVYTDGRDTLEAPSSALLNRSLALKLTRLVRF
ncbi:MAG: carbohydrate binding family 9 domain-containing protein [Acidobacteria bacterium]|nr:carbohydrate binding family 9 domain-containing protein [Acidobacteriota bacterium]